MRVSVIIVTYNPGEDIRACLQSALDSCAALDGEVIVVDNASSDGTPTLIAREFPQVRLIASPDNPGFGAANNRGFHVARGRCIVLVNPDLILLDDALKIMVEYLEQHADAGIVGPCTVDERGHIAITARHEYTVRRLLAKYLDINYLFPSLVYGTYGKLNRTSSTPFDVDWLHGSCLALRRETYEALSGFDEQFFLFLEDVDICMRAETMGWRVVFLPDARVLHVGSATVSRYPLVRVRSYHLSPLYYYRKRGHHGAVLVLKLGFTLELLAKIIMRGVRNLRHPDEVTRAHAHAEWTVIGDMWRY